MQKINPFNLRTLLYGVLVLFCVHTFRPFTKIDPKLQNYYDNYMNYVHIYCSPNKYFKPLQKTLSIGILNIEEVAVCRHNYLTRYNIIFNKEHFKVMTDEQKEITIWHEMTHCLFFIDHSPNPVHFMYAYENDIPKNIAEEQLIQLLKETCK